MLIPLSFLCEGFLYFYICIYLYHVISYYIRSYIALHYFFSIYIYILIVFMPLLQSISKFVFIIVNFDVLELVLYFIYVYIYIYIYINHNIPCHIMIWHETTWCDMTAHMPHARTCAHAHMRARAHAHMRPHAHMCACEMTGLWDKLIYYLSFF